MPINWSLELNCRHCKAKITWENEIPTIKHDRNNIISNNRAEKFITEHPRYDPEIDMPSNVLRRNNTYQLDELPTRYTPCPVCDERIYFE